MNMLFLLLAICLAFDVCGAEKCRFSYYCRPDGLCSNFTSIQDISKAAEDCLKADERAMFAYFNPSMSHISFVSRNVQELNKNFDIHLLKWILYNNKKILNMTVFYHNIEFVNVGNIDYTGYSSDYIDRDTRGFEHSQIRIHMAKSGKFEQTACNQNTSSWSHLLHSLTLDLYIQGEVYFKSFCPFWFQNVELKHLTVRNNHGFKFKQIGDVEAQNISARISELRLNDIHRLELDQNVLNNRVFSKLKSLFMTDVSLYRISPTNLFMNFTLLKNLDMSIINYRGFFHSANGTEWMAYLNYQIHVEIDQFVDKSMNRTEYESIEKNLMAFKLYPSVKSNTNLFPYEWYDFPDQDLCLFRDFPHNQLVVPMIDSTGYMNCTCTLLWLLKYRSLVYQKNRFSFLDDDGFYEILLCSPTDISSFKTIYDSCNMTHRLGMCSIQDVPTSHDPYFDMYDLKKGLEDAHLYLLTYSGPVVCLIGTITNLIIVIVILHNKHSSPHNKPATKKSKDIVLLDERLYQLMFINALINLMYCFMYLLDFSITCTPIPASLAYYSDLDQFNQYTLGNCIDKDIAIGFIGSSLKMISNTLLVFISINRFILIGKDHKEFIIKLSSVSNKELMISSSVFSCLLSVIVIFQYTTWSNPVTNLRNSNQTVWSIYDYYPVYSSTNLLKQDDPKNNLASLPVLIAFSVIHDFFSYLLFCIIILILDVATVKKLKETLAQKTAIAKNAENQESKEKAEQKSITMVCINSAVNFFLRLPEILSMICFIFFDVNPYIYKMLCVMYSRCLSLYDLSNVVYILSLSTPLFFYLGFNNNFHSAFKALHKSKTVQNGSNVKKK